MNPFNVTFVSYRFSLNSSFRVYVDSLKANLKSRPHLNIQDLPLGTVDQFSISLPDLGMLNRAINDSLKSHVVHIPYEVSIANLILPLTVGNRCVITVHDIAPFVVGSASNHPVGFPPKYSRSKFLKDNTIGKAAIATGIHNAASIICPSQHTRQEVERIFGLGGNQVRVIPHGVDHDLFKPFDKIRSRRCIGLPLDKKIILSVGTDIARKNMITLFKAFRELNHKNDYVLVRIGNDAELNEQLVSGLLPAGMRDNVLYFSGIGDTTMPYFYSSADVFVFPSYYEGFGLPVLEAMACGCPVIVSNAASLPEIVGNAGVLLDPFSVEGFSDSIVSVTEGSDVSELRKKSLKRSMEFTWERCARETLRCYLDTYHNSS